MSTHKEIKDLLEKYWEGDTSIADERALKQYFNCSDVAPELARFAPLFQVLVAERQVAPAAPISIPFATPSFEPQLASVVKRRQMNPYRYMAAAAVVLLAFGGLIRVLSPSSPDQPTELAHNTTKPNAITAPVIEPKPVTALQQQSNENLVLQPTTPKKTKTRKASKRTRPAQLTSDPETPQSPTAEEAEAAFALQEALKALDLIASTFNKGKSLTNSALKAAEVMDPFLNPASGG
jgi:hypothetical protein